MTRLLMAVVASAMLASMPVHAAQIYIVDGDTPPGLDRVLERSLPGLRILITADDRAPLTLPGVRPLDVPAGQEAYVVELRDEALELPALKLETPVLALGDGFAVVAADDRGQRNLDRLRLRKERLAWIAPQKPTRQPWEMDETILGKVDPATKNDIVGAVDQFRYGQIIQELSGALVFWLDGSLVWTNNRYTHDPGIDIAADYLEDRFGSLGLNVFRQNFTVSGTPTWNIVAEQVGTTYPDEIVVVGGHFDSISENTSTSAPGAEDNASGTAAVLHLAEVFSDYDVERTIHYVAFGGEEQGLFGSQEYVSLAGANGDNVISAITVDMISHWSSNFKVIIEGQTAWETLMSAFEANVLSEANIAYRKDYVSFGSDHVPFQQAGIPAFLAIDWDYPFYADYHRTTDTYNKLDPELGWRITKAVAGTLADLTNPTTSATSSPILPRAATLEQNQPNPFNPQTTIEFTLPHPGVATLNVYDLAGRHVVTLLDHKLEAGRHPVVWNGKNAAGDAVASGVYVYRLEAEDVSLSRRMVLVR